LKEIEKFNCFDMRKYLCYAGALLILTLVFGSCAEENFRLYVGGYTDKAGDNGLSTFSFNSRTGELKLLSQIDAGPNPSYFCYSAKNKLFYVIDEVMEFGGVSGGGLTTIKDTGSGLEKKSEMTIPNGGPCFISISHDSSFLFAANYPAGSVTVVRIGKDGIPETVTDSISYFVNSTDSSHAHMILQDPEGRHVYVTDLGLDRITEYDFSSATGKLMTLEGGVTTVSPGSGPRHFTFNADGSKLYLINELGSTIMVFNVNEKGNLHLLQAVSTLRTSYKGENGCADIHIGKNGRFLYGSNRGENTIVTFKIGPKGLLTFAGSTSCGGNWPRNFTIDPTGSFLLVGNERSDNISVFRIDKESGIPSKLVYNMVSRRPACLKIYRQQ
jgi:6-phosphogluconolactonase